MQNNGIFFGSHTCSHPILSTIAGKELKREIAESKEEIELRLGKSVDLFCYPNGQLIDINDEVVRIVEKSGYSAAVTTVSGFNDPATIKQYLMKRCSLKTSSEVEMSKILVRLP